MYKKCIGFNTVAFAHFSTFPYYNQKPLQSEGNTCAHIWALSNNLRPSILGSPTSCAPSPSLAINERRAFSSGELSRESMGLRCEIEERKSLPCAWILSINAEDAPILIDGEFGSFRDGKRLSIAAFRLINASY